MSSEADKPAADTTAAPLKVQEIPPPEDAIPPVIHANAGSIPSSSSVSPTATPPASPSTPVMTPEATKQATFSTVDRLKLNATLLSDLATPGTSDEKPIGTPLTGVSKSAAKPALARLEHETTFLSYQRELREGGTHVLNEAMLVLDIIDVKTQSLLSYISISFAGLVFLITSLPSNPALQLAFFSTEIFTSTLLALVIALLGASILCLSCLNIIGGHTIRRLASRKRYTQEEYESLVVGVTQARRDRYLAAHRITIATAVVTFVLFALLLFAPSGKIISAWLEK